MISPKNFRLAGSIASMVLLSLASVSSEGRGRSVRSDDSDTAFNALGGFWGTNNDQFGPPGFAGRTEFKLKLTPDKPPRFYTVCMSEEGFLKLVTNDTCADADFALPPTGNYIAVFATNLDSLSSGFGSLRQTRGFVDPNPPHRLWQAEPAMRFWWNAVIIDGDPGIPPDVPPTPFDVQIVLIDRSNGSNNGDFDLEFNYGNGDQIPPIGTESLPNANGFQGFKLGPNSRGPTFGPFGPFGTSDEPIRFCFRGGRLRGC
jgi:hypothetical protein